ncbi:fasciclin domain-containing protein [Naumannella cuiyingiana]|uniref:Putative surface protein with fasciclin (FAS1) repeats n=1 Tax=Naumannella cuiyingiana TaxID=1347891 RepID=A0A7Z0ILK2_9ACTN|nr:fasciclin domain-containing protein [Naumannella cuiyingiana]NYI71602.1 putative surface protein with fasciclin (FAS1) repeats [Naumannella cuiyingiana]
MIKSSIALRRGLLGLGAAAVLVAGAACGNMNAAGPTQTGAPSASSQPEATTGSSPSSAQTGAAAAEPFGPACSAIPKSGAGSFDGMSTAPVATAASNNPELSTLVSAVKEAKLVDTLNNAEDITVFAPANSAFEKLDKKTLDKAMGDPSGLLTNVLTMHVVQGRLTPDELAGEHETLNPEQKVKVEGSGESFTVNGAKVVCGNVQTANATVYIIDGVLLPQ